MSALIVQRPGVLATVQDLGRWGHQASGVPVCGAMDTWSHRFANALVGNADADATLEITIGDFEATLTGDATLAVAGGVLDVTVDGARATTPAVFSCAAGARVTTGRCSRGARAHLAVNGGFGVPEVLGSRSTYLRGGFGGFGGRSLRAGDAVPVAEATRATRARQPGGLLRAPDWLPRRGETTLLRILPSDVPEHEPLVGRLTAHVWTISTVSDRMGYRLEGPHTWGLQIADVLSTPTTMGSVQMPPSGQPILLMADRQTTGGYAQPAVVIAADLPVAAQLSPGDPLRFVTCDAAAARAAFLAREQQLIEEARVCP